MWSTRQPRALDQYNQHTAFVGEQVKFKHVAISITTKFKCTTIVAWSCQTTNFSCSLTIYFSVYFWIPLLTVLPRACVVCTPSRRVFLSCFPVFPIGKVLGQRSPGARSLVVARTETWRALRWPELRKFWFVSWCGFVVLNAAVYLPAATERLNRVHGDSTQSKWLVSGYIVWKVADTSEAISIHVILVLFFGFAVCSLSHWYDEPSSARAAFVSATERGQLSVGLVYSLSLRCQLV